MRSSSGFSLVELSIVLVILGLLTGGILAGQSLIRAAELRKASTSLNKYQGAIYSFRDKYFALPGDFTGATKFWGASDASTGTTAACYTTPQTGIATCNGNGDGIYGGTTGWASECLLSWKHLANAGLVEGNFTGIGNGTLAGINNHLVGTNCPSSINNTCFNLVDISYNAAETFPMTRTNALRLGAQSATGTARAPALLPEEQWNLDTKLDDGKPGYGRLRGFKNTSTVAPGCTTSDDPATAEYALSTSNKCLLDYFLN
jgi:prepilin-type N-terminal cleavage/methylation domain-containing protein